MKNAISCERCKLRKSKCDREHPSCQRCKDAGVSCRYQGRKRPGFPAGHRELLEDKIRRLEAEVQVLRQSDEQQQQHQEQQPQQPQQQQQEHHQQQQSTPARTLRPVVTAAAAPPAATFERNRRIAERQPPTSLVLSLVSLYFRHISPWFPFLDPPQVFSDIGSVQDPSLLHYALFGISLPFSYDIRLNQASSDSFWKYSKRRIFIEALEEPSYSALEALTILTLDISGITNGPQVWGALAVAVKLAGQLMTSGPRVFRMSATAPIESRTLSPADKTCRQRLFWAIYALDCYVSVTTSQACGLAEEQVQAFPPLQDSTWRDRGRDAEGGITPLYVFRYQLELMGIVRRLHRVYLEYTAGGLGVDETGAWLQKYSSCLAEMAQWMVSLPPCMALQRPEGGRPRGVVPSVLMLHAFFHAMVIQLHGVIAYPPEQNLATHASQLATDSRQQCLASAAMVVGIADVVAAEDVGDRLGWPFAWSLWVTARYLLVAKLNSAAEAASEGHFHVLLGSLKQMSQYWQISGKYWRLLNQAMGDLRSGRGDDANGQSGVLGLLADFRVSTSDLEDQFRTDPVLHSALSSREQVASPRNRVAREGQGDAAAPFPWEETSYLEGPGPGHVAFENWFIMPLFAASASQYYPTPDAAFDETENGAAFYSF
ncbi:uncharacterized protein B0T15DRAFT_522392 [Chaetomium strumarium]|uniref:Zn(2)-C6 fungal-type domain-containing protein n=1 Tax=Chaetomium strumarium TaxID=1170767 RepID=A0AAJ0M3T8_9PEZI|nr:hypothetical protein B0T15DRAFT_522392 [Chaetomium strumarium]